eukprot:4013848-Pyramimonas_sp.AAC.1
MASWNRRSMPANLLIPESLTIRTRVPSDRVRAAFCPARAFRLSTEHSTDTATRLVGLRNIRLTRGRDWSGGQTKSLKEKLSTMLSKTENDDKLIEALK